MLRYNESGATLGYSDRQQPSSTLAPWLVVRCQADDTAPQTVD